MRIALNNVYGIEGHKAYYRKQGTGCFDFVNTKESASILTLEEAENIAKNAEWYCKQFGASNMEIIKEEQ